MIDGKQWTPCEQNRIEHVYLTTKETWHFLFSSTRKVQILEINENAN